MASTDCQVGDSSDFQQVLSSELSKCGGIFTFSYCTPLVVAPWTQACSISADKSVEACFDAAKARTAGILHMLNP